MKLLSPKDIRAAGWQTSNLNNLPSKLLVPMQQKPQGGFQGSLLPAYPFRFPSKIFKFAALVKLLQIVVKLVIIVIIIITTMNSSSFSQPNMKPTGPSLQLSMSCQLCSASDWPIRAKQAPHTPV